MPAKKTSTEKPEKKARPRPITYDRYKVDGVSHKVPAYDATKPLYFYIEPKHVEEATPCDAQNCVIARALTDALGSLFVQVEVGARVTKVFFPERCMRYRTNTRLSKALRIFDDPPHEWTAPFQRYSLEVLSPTDRLGARPPRWRQKYKTKTKPGQDKFKPERVVKPRVFAPVIAVSEKSED